MSVITNKTAMKVVSIATFLLGAVSAWSQTFTVSTSVEGDGKPVQANGAWHTLNNNSKAVYTIAFDKGGRDVTSIRVEYSGILEGNKDIPITDGIISVEIPLGEGLNQTESFAVSYSYQVPKMVPEYNLEGEQIGEKQEGYNEYNETLQKQDATTISVYPLPSFGEIVAPSYYRYILIDKTLQWGVSIPSGGNDNWRYVWTVDGEMAVGRTFSYKPKTSGDKKITLSVQNIAPDGETIWGEKIYDSYDVTVYDVPQIEVKHGDLAFYKESSDMKFEVVIKSGGNANGYKYFWDGKEGTSVYTKDGATDGRVTLKVVNNAPDGNELQSYEDSYDYKVYPEIIVTPLKTERIVLNGKTESLSVSVPENNYPKEGEWIYKWYDVLNGVESQINNNAATLNYKAINNNTDNYESHTLRFEVTYKYNDKEWDTKKETFNVKVYATPKVEFKVKNIFSKATIDGKSETQEEVITYNPEQQEVVSDSIYALPNDQLVVEAVTNHVGNWEYESNGVSVATSQFRTLLENVGQFKHVFKAKTCLDKENPENTTFEATLACPVRIYSLPRIIPEINYVETFKGNKGQVVFVEGGSSTGWEETWTVRNGSAFDLAELDNVGIYDLTLTAANTIAGYKRYESSQDITVRTWEKPSLDVEIQNVTAKDINGNELASHINESSYNLMCYKNDSFVLGVKWNGGYNENVDAWTYSIHKNGQELSDDNVMKIDDSSLSVNISTPNTGRDAYTLKVKNFYTGEKTTANNIWAEYEIPINLTVYQNPSLMINEPQFTDYSSGQQISLVSAPNATYTQGWNYWWTDENGTRISEGSHDYIVTATNTISQNTAVKHTYTLHATNVLPDGNVGYNSSYQFNEISVWPVPFVDANFRMINIENNNGSGLNQTYNKIRGGNTLGLEVMAATGGYRPDYVSASNQGRSWEYVWSNGITTKKNYDAERYEDRLQNSARAILCATSLDDSRAVYKSTYSLNVENVGIPSTFEKNGVYEAAKTNVDVYIYRRPVTPSKMVTKGNGTSRTVNVLFDESGSNQKLINNEYYLVFGYRDASGYHDVVTKKQDTDGNLRYAVLDENTFRQPNLYVYSMWIYGNDKVTSGLCYRAANATSSSLKNENWDGSVFTNEAPMMSVTTRAAIIDDASGVEEIVESSIDDVIPVGYYALDGKPMAVPQRGFNIVKMSDGSTKKIYVK